jgi:uncharacterized membrane protein SpoIIM required for sporulation
MTQPTQEEFMAGRRHHWNALDSMIGAGPLKRQAPMAISQVASLYRSACGDLMVARARGYAPDLIEYLEGLAARASNELYGTRESRLPGFFEILASEFPRTLRRRWRFFLTAALLFLLPLALGIYGTYAWDGFAEGVMPPAQLSMMSEMYQDGYDAGRAEAIDSAMAGHYVENNVGIALRCFATGILLGLGSMFFLVYNGLIIGTTVAWVIQTGGGPNILTFMCGHGVFELTAIVISGAAGIQMGYSLVDTKGRTRLGSLRAQASELVSLVVGAGALLFIAAGLEAFWSPSSLPPPVKWAAAAVFAVLLTLYLVFAGREYGRPGGRR